MEVQSLERFPNQMETYTVEGGVATFISANKIHLRIQVFNQDIIRFRYAEYGLFERDFSYAVEGEPVSDAAFLSVKEEGEVIRLELERFDVELYRLTMKTTIRDKEGHSILEDEKGYHWEENPDHGGNIVFMTKYMHPGEAFYGLGDKSTHMNMRGKRLRNWGTDEYGYHAHQDPLYKNISFFYGLHQGIGYGLFLDNTFETHYDFGSERQNVFSYWALGGEMNYYYVHGPELTKVAERFTDLTGRPELPPMWALGYHQSKWSYYPESEVRGIASKMRELRIPCDVLHIDIDYMDGFRCFTWDKEKFPEPKVMIQDLKEDGFKTVVIIDPGIKIDFDYHVFQQGLEKGYFCKRADGPYIKGKVWPGDCYFPDFTKPEVRDWWRDLFKELIEEEGVEGVWNDMNEPALFEVENKSFPNDVRHDFDGDPCSHRKAHNIYGMQMTRATFEGVKKYKNGRRPLVITRSCYAGIQRYSAAWTGDNIANWDHIWLASVQCQRLAISGLSFVGSDVGGFINQPTGELFVRWMQLALFHPFFRTHSSGDHGDQEPWSFGENITDLVRKSIELRYQLLPYLYTTFYQCSERGTPFLRPLVFEDQTDRMNVGCNEIFVVGDHILSTPVQNGGVMGKMFYLPRGFWYDFWTGEKLAGGQEINLIIPLDKTAFLIREGGIVPMFPVQQYVGEKQIDAVELVLTEAGEEAVTSEWYEDDGDTYAHLEGEYRLHQFVNQRKGGVWTVTHTSDGNYNSTVKQFRLKLMVASDIQKIMVDGTSIEAGDDGSYLVDYGFERLEVYG